MSDPIFLSGISGFIAKRIALDLLNAGHFVRGSIRSPGRAAEVRETLAKHVNDPSALDRLSLVVLDLASDDGWADALSGTRALLHTASPFPMTQPKNEADIIRPAVDGTLRALRAAQAAGVTRVVLTSSVVSVEGCDKAAGEKLTREDWTDPNHPICTPYYRSKTLAERAAWDFVAEHPDMELTTINPALVLGAPLDGNYGTSLQVLARILAGKDPVLPNIGFGLVDVADISAAHIAALDNPDSVGKRYLMSAGTKTMPELGQYLKTRYPDRKIATRAAPKFLLQFLSLFDPSLKSVLPGLGRLPLFDASPAEAELGLTLTPWEVAVDRAAAAILHHG